MEQSQEQYQGPERRQSQTQYQGEGRRKHDHDPIFDEPTLTPATNPGMSTQERKDEQQERTRQQYENRHDEL